MNPFYNDKEPLPGITNRPKPMTQEQMQTRLKEIHQEKVALMDKYGLFGGGQAVNERFRALNTEEDNLSKLIK